MKRKNKIIFGSVFIVSLLVIIVFYSGIMQQMIGVTTDVYKVWGTHNVQYPCPFTNPSNPPSWNIPNSNPVNVFGLVTLSDFSAENGYSYFSGCTNPDNWQQYWNCVPSGGNMDQACLPCTTAYSGTPTVTSTTTDAYGCTVKTWQAGDANSQCWYDNAYQTTRCYCALGGIQTLQLGGANMVYNQNGCRYKMTITDANGTVSTWDSTNTPTVLETENYKILKQNSNCNAPIFSGCQGVSVQPKNLYINLDITYETPGANAYIGEELNIPVTITYDSNIPTSYITVMPLQINGQWTYDGLFGTQTQSYSTTVTLDQPTKTFNIQIPTQKTANLKFKFTSATVPVALADIPNAWHEVSWTSGSSSASYPVTVDITENEFYIGTACEILPNHLLASETFTQGTTLTKYSFRYPVSSFCSAHPVIKLDSNTMLSTADSSPYTTWDAGGSLVIPEGQVWTVFYIMENNGQIPTVCTDTAYNVQTETCEISLGVVHFCSEGQFDPALGACVVQPESEIICDAGYFDTAQGICIWHPPVQAVCEPPGIYNVDTNMCEYTPDSENVCETGYVYNPDTEHCQRNPESIIYCDPGYSYSSTEDQCIKYVDSQIECDNPNAIYIPEDGLCILTPAESVVCSKGVLEEVNGIEMCIFEPELHGICTQGNLQTINGEQVCVVEPNWEYFCLQGTISVDPITNQHICKFDVDTKYYCKDPDAIFNETTKMCIKETDTTYSGKLNIQWWHVTIVVIILSLIGWYIMKRKRRRR